MPDTKKCTVRTCSLTALPEQHGDCLCAYHHTAIKHGAAWAAECYPNYQVDNRRAEREAFHRNHPQAF